MSVVDLRFRQLFYFFIRAKCRKEFMCGDGMNIIKRPTDASRGVNFAFVGLGGTFYCLRSFQRTEAIKTSILLGGGLAVGVVCLYVVAERILQCAVYFAKE